MHIRPLFLRTSGSSGVLKALLLEGMDNYPVTQKKKKKTAPSQPAQPEIVRSQLAAEQQGAVPDDEPLLEADFPLPGSFQLPTVIGTPVFFFFWVGETFITKMQ